MARVPCHLNIKNDLTSSCLWLWSTSPPAFQIDTPGQKLEMSRKCLNPVKRYPSREFLWPSLLQEHFQKRHNKCLLTQTRAPTRDQSEGFTKASLREQMICLACLQSRGRWEVIYKIIPDPPKSQITGNPHSSTNDGFLQKHSWMSPISATLHNSITFSDQDTCSLVGVIYNWKNWLESWRRV